MPEVASLHSRSLFKLSVCLPLSLINPSLSHGNQLVFFSFNTTCGLLNLVKLITIWSSVTHWCSYSYFSISHTNRYSMHFFICIWTIFKLSIYYIFPNLQLQLAWGFQNRLLTSAFGFTRTSKPINTNVLLILFPANEQQTRECF
jgi:hypothetical protein